MGYGSLRRLRFLTLVIVVAFVAVPAARAETTVAIPSPEAVASTADVSAEPAASVEIAVSVPAAFAPEAEAETHALVVVSATAERMRPAVAPAETVRVSEAVPVRIAVSSTEHRLDRIAADVGVQRAALPPQAQRTTQDVAERAARPESARGAFGTRRGTVSQPGSPTSVGPTKLPLRVRGAAADPPAVPAQGALVAWLPPRGVFHVDGAGEAANTGGASVFAVLLGLFLLGFPRSCRRVAGGPSPPGGIGCSRLLGRPG